jgi:hypothetical protein
MTFNDTQIPSNCKFTPNMDIKTWKPGVALMFERWSKSGTSQTFNDAINGRFEDASEYIDGIGKTAEEIAKNHFDSAWYAAGKTIPSDYETYISCDNSTFDHADMTIVVDPNTKEILLATMHSD